MSSLSKLNREMYIFSSLHPMKETNYSLIYKQYVSPPPPSVHSCHNTET